MTNQFFKGLCFCLILGVLISPIPGATARPLQASVGAPTVVSYQGRVAVSGTPYTGTGYFKFAVVNSAGSTSYWSNDGTSSGGSEPTASLSLSVTAGLFHVLLGDTNLTGMSSAMTDSVFSTSTDTYLRIWFSSDNATFTQLTPDQKIAAVPYALQAESAKDADNLDGLDSSAFQLRVTGTCQPGATIHTIDATGAVHCESHDTLPLFSFVDHGMVGIGHDVAINPDGLPMILSYSGDQINAVVCHDIQCNQATSSSYIPIPGAAYALGISMAFGVDALAAFTIWDSVSGTAFLGHCNDPYCTTVVMTPLTGWVFPPGQVNMDLTMTIDGLPMIAAIEFITGNLFALHCLDPLCGGIAPAAPFTTAVGTPSITIMGDGFPMLAYVDFATGSLGTIVCTDGFCMGGAVVAVHGTVTTVAEPVAATAADGFGMIAYIDTSVPSVRYAKCTSASCGTLTTNHIWGVTLPAQMPRPSIVNGADGLPLIGFYDDTTIPGSPPINPGFYAAHCGNLLCSSTTTNQLAQGPLDGLRSALTIGTDGMPFVTYDLSATTTVMAMHCSNAFCVPFWRGW